MTPPRLLLAGLVLALTSGSSVLLGATPASADEGQLTQRLVRMVRNLEPARERPRGYEREKFVHWTDADGDGCDTRDEVLLAEAVTEPSTDDDCDLAGGEWFSWYDGEELDDSSDLDIDHVVALAEAWASGARRWTKGTRQRFANDLGDRRSLVAASASSNRSKSDSDPAEWLPRPRAHCRYVVAWVATKTRWQLRVDRSEKRAVRRVADDCRNVKVRVDRARVVTR